MHIRVLLNMITTKTTTPATYVDALQANNTSHDNQEVDLIRSLSNKHQK